MSDVVEKGAGEDFCTPSPFVGRAALLEMARECVQDKECLSLVGEPGSGMSTLLNYLTTQDFRRQCRMGDCSLQFIYVNCKHFDDPLPLLRHLLGQIAPSRPIPNLPSWRPMFGRLIAALDGLEHTRVAILLDHFEPMGRNERFADFLESFRGLVPRAGMPLITATYTELKNCCSKQLETSQFYNIFKVHPVPPFSAEESREFIAAYSSAAGCDLQPFAREILMLGGRLPYYLQLACAVYQRQLSQGGPIDHQALAAQFLADARPAFDRAWQRLTDSERKALRALAAGKFVSEPEREPLERKGYVANAVIFAGFLAYVATLAKN